MNKINNIFRPKLPYQRVYLRMSELAHFYLLISPLDLKQAAFSVYQAFLLKEKWR